MRLSKDQGIRRPQRRGFYQILPIQTIHAVARTYNTSEGCSGETIGTSRMDDLYRDELRADDKEQRTKQQRTTCLRQVSCLLFIRGRAVFYSEHTVQRNRESGATGASSGWVADAQKRVPTTSNTGGGSGTGRRSSATFPTSGWVADAQKRVPTTQSLHLIPI
jgi:hypothetical protein